MTVLPWLCGALSLALGATAATCAVLATRLRGATGGSPPESPEMTAPMEEPPPAIGDGEPFLRDIVEGSADGVHVLDLDGHVLFSSRSGLALLQSGSDGPCLGRSFVDLWPRCERDEVLAAIAAASFGATSYFSSRRTAVGAPTRHFDVLVTALKSSDGRPERLVVMLRNTTHLRRAEDELRAKTALLETTLSAMDQGLIMVDAQGLVPVVNRRAMELLGLPPALMQSPPDYRVIRDRQRLRWGDLVDGSQYWIMSDHERSEDVRCERRSADGDTIEIRTVPLPNGGVVQTFSDITHLKRAESAVRESEARYRLLAESASDIILLQNPDHGCRYVSPAVEAVLGYGVEEFEALAPDTLVHPEDLGGIEALSDALSDPGRRTTSVHRMRHKRGHWVWMEATYRAAAPSEPGEANVIAVMRDVTDRQTQAEELRTAKTLAELAQARAELANQAKSDFLAAMSHEIRTPLNSLVGFADLLSESGTLAPEQSRQVELIRSASGALLTVLNDILDFSKIEAGATEIEHRPFDLPALIETCAKLTGAAAHAKQLEIRVRTSPDLPPTLMGDDARLRQVLLNLLNNAVKFTAAGFVELAVETLPQADERRALIRFSVTDTGPGIPKAKQGRLFQRFSQIDSSISRTFGGTGLGLAISRGLVERMGGEIGVDSDDRAGATFWFTLALQRSPASVQADAARLVAARAPAKTGRVLVVEDVAVNQELARAVLEAAGHRVDVVGDGADAVSAVQAQTYDLVLMDVQMPGMDGMTATRRIRALDHPSRHLPIVAMTASVFPEQVRQFRRAGMNDHVAKPFKRPDLYAVVERWLPDGEGARSAASAPPGDDRIDLVAFSDLSALLGSERVAGLLDRLAEQIAPLFEGDDAAPGVRQRFRLEAHALIGAAGLIGFRDLADLCRRLEEADMATDEFGAVLGRLRDEQRWSLGKIASLRHKADIPAAAPTAASRAASA